MIYNYMLVRVPEFPGCVQDFENTSFEVRGSNVSEGNGNGIESKEPEPGTSQPALGQAKVSLLFPAFVERKYPMAFLRVC